jgi:hypothetical protein
MGISVVSDNSLCQDLQGEIELPIHVSNQHILQTLEAEEAFIIDQSFFDRV